MLKSGQVSRWNIDPKLVRWRTVRSLIRTVRHRSPMRLRQRCACTRFAAVGLKRVESCCRPLHRDRELGGDLQGARQHGEGGGLKPVDYCQPLSSTCGRCAATSSRGSICTPTPPRCSKRCRIECLSLASNCAFGPASGYTLGPEERAIAARMWGSFQL
jgi:hypothetical protein